MKIYTRTGDAGTTSLVGGKRVSKADERLEAYGTVDEFNSHLGLLVAIPDMDAATVNFIHNVQNKLFNIGAYLATDAASTSDDFSDTPTPKGLSEADVDAIEHEIDRLEEQLPPLTSFILPGGCRPACHANIARTVCRRAERRIIALDNTLRQHANPQISPIVLAYFNRLSDYLFNLARYINLQKAAPELPWRP